MFLNVLPLLCLILVTESYGLEHQKICYTKFIDGKPVKALSANEDCGAAQAIYSNKINKTGWAFLEININDESLAMHEQGYLMGYSEGKVSRYVIELHLKNMIEPYCKDNSEYCSKLFKYLVKNYDWMMTQIQKLPDIPYWQQLNMTLNQVQGVMDGFDGAGYRSRKMSTYDIVTHPVYLTQWLGDLMDLEKKYKKKPNGIRTGSSHCSAIVKVLPDFSDILFSHVTWFSFASLLRVQKKYSFAIKSPGRTYSFSGYPGVVNSIDDFLLNSAKLAIFETTIELYNEKLFNKMIPQSVPTWARTQVATRMSENGVEWARTFTKHNSGTYNNQFVIVDYKLFKKGEEAQSSGLIRVLEQMPGLVVHTDKTHQLMETTYWPSYNRPYFKQIGEASGAFKMAHDFGNWYSYDHAPRANIFRRDHMYVVDTYSLIHLMRYNNFKKDKFSRCEDCVPPYSAESTIAARSDLNDPNGTYPIADLGFMDQCATDVKVTSSELIDSLSFTAISGPTNNPTPVFDWKTSPLRDLVPHYGQPDVWKFPAVTHEWHSVDKTSLANLRDYALRLAKKFNLFKFWTRI